MLVVILRGNAQLNDTVAWIVPLVKGRPVRLAGFDFWSEDLDPIPGRLYGGAVDIF